MKKRLISIALVLAMVLSVIPFTVFATESGVGGGSVGSKAVALGDSGIADGDTTNAKWDYVYFGEYGGNPTKWRVLSKNGSSTTRNDGKVDTATYKDSEGNAYTGKAMFMLSEDILGEAQFDSSRNKINVWESSTLHGQMSSYFESSTGEEKYILKTTKSGETEDAVGFINSISKPYAVTSYGDSMADDTLFLLSAREVETYLGKADANHIAKYNGESELWWLRSQSGSSFSADYVYSDGYVNYHYYVYGSCGIRPALNLNLSSVLFTTPAVGGKDVTTGLKVPAEYTGNEYKLTLLDETRSFAVTEKTLTGYAGNGTEFTYTGAETGDTEYISAMIVDGKGDILYYGQLQNSEKESGTARFKIPATLSADKYKVYIFNEQINDDKKSDFASAFAEVTLTVKREKTVMLGNSAISGGDAENVKWDYVYFGKYNGKSIKWRVLSKNGSNTTRKDGTVDTATYETVDQNKAKLSSGEYQYKKYDGNALFMLSEEVLGLAEFDSSSDETNLWESSTLHGQMSSYFSSSTGEEKYVLKTTKKAPVINKVNPVPYDEASFIDSNGVSYIGLSYGDNMKDDTLFLLSAREVESYLGKADANHIAKYNGRSEVWWLRSQSSVYGVDSVIYDGGVGGNEYLDETVGVRPALNLNLSSVLFTTPAVGGKNVNAGLKAPREYTGDEYKLTLLDETRKFAVTEKELEGKIGNNVEFNYTGAETSDKDYISAMFVDGKGDVLYYGQLQKSEKASGTVKLKLPDTLTEGEYKVYIFNEQINGDKESDFASAFSEVTLTVKAEKTITLGNSAISGGDTENATWKYVYFGKYNRNPIKWRVLSKNGSSTTRSDGTVDTATYVDSEGNAYTDGAMFMLSEDILREAIFDGNGSNVWESSALHGQMSSYFESSTGEEKYILKTSKKSPAFDEDNPAAYDEAPFIDSNGEPYTCKSYGDSMADDTLFLLSVREVEAYLGKADANHVAKYNGESDRWWLRSQSGSSYEADDVYSDGYVYNNFVDNTYGVRPALNLKLSEVLFTTGISGRPSDPNNGLEKNENYEGNEYKLTLYDKEHDGFTLVNTTAFGVAGGEGAVFNYTGAKTGKREYISAMILDGDGNILYYGQIGEVSESGAGSARLEVPKGLAAGDYTVKLFNEQVNGKTESNLAGNFKTATLKVRNAHEVTLNTNGADSCAKLTSYLEGVGATLPIPVKNGYSFGGWFENESFTGSAVTAISATETGDKVFYAKWSAINYVISYDLDGGTASNPTNYNVETETFTLNAPTKTGYSFTGWSGTGLSGNNNLTVEIKKGSTGGRSFKAHYTDIAAPTGTVTVGENSWNTLLNTITFGLFFNKTQEVTITATDNSGETVKIEYLLSDKALTSDELSKATFTEYKGEFNIDPSNEYVIYAKLSDSTGNTAYINSDGIVLDNVSPVISGVENGRTYCAAVEVTITEKYVDTVTVDGKAQALTNGKFTLSPKATAQKIVVTDKAGNKAEITVTVNDGHTGGTATCTKQAVCSVCGNEYGDLDKTNHTGGTEIRNAKDAKCTEDGYTGDTHCKDCGGKLDTGKPITKLGHEDKNKDHICDRENCKATISTCSGGTATCKAKAVCDYCGNGYGDLDKTNHTGGTEVRNAKDAKCTEDGYTGDTYCKGCGDKLDTGTPITKLGHVDSDKNHICDRENCKATISTCYGGEANCHEKAVCDYCGKEYGDVDKTNHTGTATFKSTDEHTHEKVWSCCGTVIETKISHRFDGDGVCRDCGYGLPTFTVTYTDGFGGKAFKDETHTVPKDYATPAPTVSTKNYNGYSFKGWDKTVAATVTADVTYTAVWTDVTAPKGGITVDKNSWNTFFNTITFGLFFNKTQEVKIEATDNSGVTVKIEYLLSDKALTSDELSKATFTEYKSEFNIDPNNEYVIYAKLSDSTGNTAYVNSDGIVLDNVVPVISGVENGKTYCAAVEVTITEKYVDTVTVDGDAVTLNASGKFTLSPKATAQKIVVTDKAGNSTEVTVTVNDGHTGGTATCTKQAVCSVCGTPYGDVDKTNHTGEKEWTVKTDSEHEQKWSCCGEVTVKKAAHDFGTGSVCDICGYGCSHEDKDKNHVCELCGVTISEHTGGTANCHEKAVCDYCGNEYGDLDKSNHDGGTETRNDKAATCTEDGYTGDTYCKGCGDKLDTGKPITKLGHVDSDKNHICDRENCKETLSTCSGGKANCHEKAICDYCGNEYGDLDKSNHDGGTETRNDKAATCTEDGYTGDTYCKGCGEKLDTGKPIEKLGHADENSDHKCDICGKTISECADEDKDHKCDVCGAVISEHEGGQANCRENAICDICGGAYGEKDPDTHGNLEHIKAKKATTEKEGNIEYWHCADCNKYFSDKACKHEITLADTVIAKKTPDNAAETGDSFSAALFVLLAMASAGTLIGVNGGKKKRKKA